MVGGTKGCNSRTYYLDAFHKISGLKVNNEKTEELWIGASSGNQQEFLPKRSLKWAALIARLRQRG